MGRPEIVDCKATVEVIFQAAALGDTFFYTNRDTTGLFTYQVKTAPAKPPPRKVRTAARTVGRPGLITYTLLPSLDLQIQQGEFQRRWDLLGIGAGLVHERRHVQPVRDRSLRVRRVLPKTDEMIDETGFEEARIPTAK